MPTDPDESESLVVPRMLYVVSVSSGAASAYCWAQAIERYGVENVVGVFADVNREHPDNYRFLAEVHQLLGGRLVKLTNNGDTIWDVFKRSRFLGNSRIDPCSRVLKREAIEGWLKANCDPVATTIIVGLDWTEMHRVKRNREAWGRRGWLTEFPMVDRPADKSEVMAWLATVGIKAPVLYDLGFAHANCGGGCVKAGIKQFKHLLTVLPDEYAYWEAQEEEMRQFLDADVSILTDRRGGDRKPMTLRQLREEVQGVPSLFDDLDDEKGCDACFTDWGDDEDDESPDELLVEAL